MYNFHCETPDAFNVSILPLTPRDLIMHVLETWFVVWFPLHRDHDWIASDMSTDVPCGQRRRLRNSRLDTAAEVQLQCLHFYKQVRNWRVV